MTIRQLVQRLLGALLVVLAVGIVGVTGYMAVAKMSFFDALYTTTITVGQVGFGNGPTTMQGKLFTVFLTIGGVTATAFVLAAVVGFIVEADLGGYLEGRRMNKLLSDIEGHTVIAGLGRVGYVTATQLARDGVEFVIIDQSDEARDTAKAEGWLVVQGDATEEEVLKRAGIERAASLVSTLDSDAENLFVTVTARALNPTMLIVARSTHATSEDKLLKGGADRVITPNVIGGRRMAAMVKHPYVVDYLDLVSHGDEVEFRLQEVDVPTGSPFEGMSIADAAVREKTGAYILAIRDADGRMDTNPQPDRTLAAGQHLIVLGTRDQVATFERQCGVLE